MTYFLLATLVAAAAPAERPAADDADRRALRDYVAAVTSRKDAAEKIDLPDGSSDAVRRWVEANPLALHGVRRGGGLRDQPWGLSGLKPAPSGEPTCIYLYVFDWHASGKLIVYGLTGGVGKAYLLSDPARKALPSATQGYSTVYTVSKQPPDPLATVVVLEMADKTVTMGLWQNPGNDGRVTLHARDAIVHGRTLRYEPEPHKDTLGYWSDPSDWAAWDFEVAQPGTYAVEILQGCGKGSGGSRVEFAAAGQVLPVTVQDTGSFQNFVARRIGELRIDQAGRHTLTVKPTHKPGVAVMDLRAVTLTPVKKAQ
jgi:hypothetical protein